MTRYETYKVVELVVLVAAGCLLAEQYGWRTGAAVALACWYVKPFSKYVV